MSSARRAEDGSVREKIPEPITNERPREKVATVCDVNDRYVQDAKKLFSEAPALFEKVKVRVIKLPAAMSAIKRKSDDPAAWSQLLDALGYAVPTLRAEDNRRLCSPVE